MNTKDTDRLDAVITAQPDDHDVHFDTLDDACFSAVDDNAAPAPAQPPSPGWLTRLRHFWVFVFRHFRADRCTNTAGMLTYTTLLSMVPLMAVAFGSLAAFPVFESVSVEVQDFIFDNFVPAAGEAVQAHMQTFMSKASGLTLTGIVFLILGAVLLMGSIDGALNRIWRVYRRRSLLQAFLVYWAILTLGPMLVGASLALTSYLVSIPLLSEASGVVDLKVRLLSLVPFLATALAFTLIYTIVPNRHVPFRAALLGGAIAAVVFELAKRAFAWYITNFPTYEAIYGALAAIPIFLVWVYLSWVIVLFGAEITYAVMSFGLQRAPEGSAKARFIAMYRILGHLNEQHCGDGKPLHERELQKREPGVGPSDLSAALDTLDNADFIQAAKSGGWMLSRSLGHTTVADLLHCADAELPRDPGPTAQHPQSQDVADWDRRLNGLLRAADERISPMLSTPLAVCYSMDTAPKSEPTSEPASESNAADTESASPDVIK